MTISMVAFVPARSGSKRVPDKNVKPLAGHPMLAYSVRAAIDSGVFSAVICATDSEEYAAIARHYGAEVPFLRDETISGDTSPDIQWVQWMLRKLAAQDRTFDAFSILRPTSPFRLPSTIKRAHELFVSDSADSLRAIEKCKQHPGKMWKVDGNRMTPFIEDDINGTPFHSSQYASLPPVYAQDASLEIAWTKTALEKGSIAGNSIIPFISRGLEGFDINDQLDWLVAEQLIKHGEAILPSISTSPYIKKA